MKYFSLVRRFIVLSLFAFLITGLTLGILISKHFKDEMLGTIQDTTTALFDATIKPILLPARFDESTPITISPELDGKAEELKALDAFIDITIWDRDGNVLYSKNSTVSLKTVNAHLLNSAMMGNTLWTISNISVEEDRNSIEKVIRIYAPIKTNERVVGAFSVDKSYREVEMHLQRLNMILIIVISVGLLILYLFLLRTVSTASKQLAEQNRSLLDREKELQESYGKLNENYKSTVLTLSKAVDARDSYTAGHSERVAKLTVTIGRRLGLTDSELETLELAALFHDIGKLGVPDSILNKEGELTNLEYAKIKEHPVTGMKILQNIDFLGGTLRIIRYHHERFAGGGYPEGIRGEDIPLGSRIIAIADTYDAITSDRPYRKGLSHIEAIEELIRFKNIQFDPVIVDIFLGIQKPECSTSKMGLKAM